MKNTKSTLVVAVVMSAMSISLQGCGPILAALGAVGRVAAAVAPPVLNTVAAGLAAGGNPAAAQNVAMAGQITQAATGAVRAARAGAPAFYRTNAPFAAGNAANGGGNVVLGQ